MYSIVTSKRVPLSHEIIFDEEAMSILFSLCPEANNYFLEMLGRENLMTNYLKSQRELSLFVFPNEKSWGFGDVFKVNNSKSIESGWITWECQLPRKATSKNMNDIAGSIYQLTNVMQLFVHDNETKGSKEKIQFMTIDGIMVNSDSFFHAGGFSFSFARPVLEFCKKIWDENGTLYNEIINAMKKTWIHLLGEKKIKSYDEYSFRISQSQGDKRLISLRCPGDCA